MQNRKKLGVTLLAAVAGGGGGFLYYYFIGCTGGACPITGNPVISTVYGAILGILIAVILLPGEKNSKKE